MGEATRKLGPYTLVTKIGVGGFGVVWLAEKQTKIATTQVALKLPRGEDIDLEAFRQEAAIWIQASGHPNVLPLIDADIYDDQVVIVSEYVPDGSLAGWLKQHGGKAPSAEAACEMMEGVLAGLAHLHTRHIIHRDLKPENILLQRETPRLADFGIARLLKSSSHSAKISGTLAYMAPEAFDGKRNEQTDVWSTGVIFYELLAARLPYDQPDIPSFIGAIMRHDPPPLPQSVPEVLRLIVMKALQRDPANRYSSAADMRRDLREAERLLWLKEREAKEALPPPMEIPPRTLTLPESSANRELPATMGVPQPTRQSIGLPQPGPTGEKPPQPTIGAIGPPTNTFDISPASERLSGDLAKRKSQRVLWLAGAAVAVVVVLVMAAGFFSLGAYLWVSAPKPIKEPTTPFVLKQTLVDHRDSINSVAFAPDGKTLASASVDATIKLWDVQTGNVKQTLPGEYAKYLSVTFSPDGQTIASGSSEGKIKLWDARTGKLKQILVADSFSIPVVAFSPDGRSLASGSTQMKWDKTLKLWDVKSGEVKQNFYDRIDEFYMPTISTLAFSPDGKTLAAASPDKLVKLFDVNSGQLKQTFTGHTGWVKSISFSPDGKTLASGGGIDPTVKLWDVQSGQLKQTLTGHTGSVDAVAFSPGGKTLATGGADKTIKLWDVQTNVLKQILTGHTDGILSIAFSPDGKTLASGSADKTVKLWRAE